MAAILGKNATIIIVELVEDAGLRHLELDLCLAEGLVENIKTDLISSMLLVGFLRLDELLR